MKRTLYIQTSTNVKILNILLDGTGIISETTEWGYQELTFPEQEYPDFKKLFFGVMNALLQHAQYITVLSLRVANRSYRNWTDRAIGSITDEAILTWITE